MANYHFWHPAFVAAEPLTLEVFLTQGDALLPPAGGEKTAAAILETLGAESTINGTDFNAIRTAYFSSYRENSTDWRDAWSLTWTLRITLDTDRAPTIPNPPSSGYFDLNSAATVPESEAQSWPCILIADAPTTKILNAACAITKRSFPDARILLGRAFGRYSQLRCDIGERTRSWYEDGATEAEATLTALSQAGATVRFDGLLGSRQE